MSLTAHSRRGIWRPASKINTKPSGTQTNKQTVYQHYSVKLKSAENKGRVVKIHSSLVVVIEVLEAN